MSAVTNRQQRKTVGTKVQCSAGENSFPKNQENVPQLLYETSALGGFDMNSNSLGSIQTRSIALFVRENQSKKSLTATKAYCMIHWILLGNAMPKQLQI